MRAKRRMAWTIVTQNSASSPTSGSIFRHDPVVALAWLVLSIAYITTHYVLVEFRPRNNLETVLPGNITPNSNSIGWYFILFSHLRVSAVISGPAAAHFMVNHNERVEPTLLQCA